MKTSAAGFVAAVVRPEIRSLAAYHVPAAAGMIKLDAMENPYALPDALRVKLAAAVATVPVNRYPDGDAAAVKAALRAHFAISPEHDVVLGNGSDELIHLAALSVASPGATMLSPDPSFVMYRLTALLCGMRFVGVPLRPDFALDAEAVLAAIDREKPALVFIAWPNNPTGNLFAEDDVARIIRAAPGLVIVDEAYHAFARASFLPRIAEFPNLVVLRTVSKIGMAGLRLGYAVGAPEWIAELNKVRPPYNLNALTQAVAPVLLAEHEPFAAQADAIVAGRAALEAALAALPGVTVHPTRTNFVLARFPDAPRCHAALSAAKILVKNLHGAHPLLAHCLRITVGTPAENDALMTVLRTLQ